MSIIFNLILWIQVLYSLWQFVRVTKFLRLPYVFLGMLWNKGYKRSCLKVRQVLKLTQLRNEGYCNMQQVPVGYTLSYERRREINFVYKLHELDIEGNRLYNGPNVFECSFTLDGVLYEYILKPDVCHMLQLYLEDVFDAYTQETVLYKGVSLLKCESHRNIIDFISVGGNMIKKNINCILDYTSEDYLNQNFMRILSIVPLVLQAKGLSTLSTTASAFIIAIDYLSYPLNKFWDIFKNAFFKYFKYLLSFLPKGPRVCIHHFLSTGTDSFMYCDEIKLKSYFKKCKTFPIILNARSRSMKIIDRPPNNYFNGFEYMNRVGMGYPFVIEGETVCLFVKDSGDKLELDNRRPKYCIEISSASLGIIKVNAVQWELTRFLNFLKVCEDVGIPAKIIDGNSCHLYSLKELLLTMNFNDIVIVEFEREIDLFVSDIRISYNLFKLMKRKEISDQCICKCFNYIRHFINKGVEGSKFSKDADIDVLKSGDYILSVVTGLLCGSNGCSRPFGWMNSQWKRLCNDVKGILVSDKPKGNLTITKKISKSAMNFIMTSANQAILDSGLKIVKFVDSVEALSESSGKEPDVYKAPVVESVKVRRKKAIRANSKRKKESLRKQKKLDAGVTKLKETISKLKLLPKSKRIDERIAQLESNLKEMSNTSPSFISNDKMPKYSSYKDALSSNLSLLNPKSDEKMKFEVSCLPPTIVKNRRECVYDPVKTMKEVLIPTSNKKIEKFRADRDNFVVRLTSNRFKCLEDIEEFESKGEEYLGKKEAKRKRKGIMTANSRKAPSGWYEALEELKSSIYYMRGSLKSVEEGLQSKAIFENNVSNLSNVYETFKTLKGVAQSKRVVDSCYGVLTKVKNKSEINNEKNVCEEGELNKANLLSKLIKEEAEKLTVMNQAIEEKRREIIRNTEIGVVCGYEPVNPVVKLKIKTIFKKGQVVNILRDVVKSSVDPNMISVGQLNKFKIIRVKTKSEEDPIFDRDCIERIHENILILKKSIEDAKKILTLCGDGKYL